MKSTVIFSLLTIFLITLSLDVRPNDPPKNAEQGIAFFEGTWSEALQKAKKEKKLIFLDVYATWCGPCKRLAAITFVDEEVGKYYNKRFINVRVDGEKGEGRTLAQRYGVRAYPTLLFLDYTGEVVHTTAGFRDPQRFIELGQSVKDPSRSK